MLIGHHNDSPPYHALSVDVNNAGKGFCGWGFLYAGDPKLSTLVTVSFVVDQGFLVSAM